MCVQIKYFKYDILGSKKSKVYVCILSHCKAKVLYRNEVIATMVGLDLVTNIFLQL